MDGRQQLTRGDKIVERKHSSTIRKLDFVVNMFEYFVKLIEFTFSQKPLWLLVTGCWLLGCIYWFNSFTQFCHSLSLFLFLFLSTVDSTAPTTALFTIPMCIGWKWLHFFIVLGECAVLCYARLCDLTNLMHNININLQYKTNTKNRIEGKKRQMKIQCHLNNGWPNEQWNLFEISLVLR